MVSSPAVVEAVTVAEYVPSPLSVVDPNVTSPDVENVTVSPATGLACASVTVATAVVVEEPSAVIVDDGLNDTAKFAAAPATSCKVPRPDTAPSWPTMLLTTSV